jgi:hypothetical protein
MTKTFKQFLADAEFEVSSNVLESKGDQGQYSNDEAERAMIHKIIDMNQLGIKSNISYDIAYSFLESDLGAELWEEFYDLFKQKVRSFEGPFDKRRFKKFRDKCISLFRKWQKSKL